MVRVGGVIFNFEGQKELTYTWGSSHASNNRGPSHVSNNQGECWVFWQGLSILKEKQIKTATIVGLAYSNSQDANH